jgi:hypothetical protein
MTVLNALYVDAGFQGEGFFTSANTNRYSWNTWGGHNDLFSSMRCYSFGQRGNSYAFEHIDFSGRYAALNVGGAYSSAWWAYFGDDFNDAVSSSLVVAREPADRESAFALKAPIVNQFGPILAAKTVNTPLSIDGGPEVYATFFPSWSPNDVFLAVRQNFTAAIKISVGPFGISYTFDYDVRATWYIRLFVTQDGGLHARAVRSEVSVHGVEPDAFLAQAGPPLHAAKSDITARIEGQLALLARRRYSDAYLLPGPAPDMQQAGFSGRHTDDVCLVLVDG